MVSEIQDPKGGKEEKEEKHDKGPSATKGKKEKEEKGATKKGELKFFRYCQHCLRYEK